MKITPRSGFSLLSFLDLERISDGDNEDVSSIKNLDLLSKESEFSISLKSLSDRFFASNSFFNSIFPSRDINLYIIDLADISKLKRTEGMPSFTNWPAILSANAVFPMLGRPAITNKSPCCKPIVILSKSLKPVLIPTKSPSDLMVSSILS